MSLHPQHPIPPVPDETARIARAAFPKGNPYLLLREQLGVIFADGDFADLYSGRWQPSYPPWRLALVTLLQFREGLSDRQAAEAGRARIDWKHLLYRAAPASPPDDRARAGRDRARGQQGWGGSRRPFWLAPGRCPPTQRIGISFRFPALEP